MAGQDNDTQQNDLFFEKPPSPVLSHKTTRKYLLSKKMQRKSRVKLTDRFSEDPVNFSDTFNSLANTTLTITSCDATQLEKVESEEEKIERNEISKKNVTEDFDFKKPESPAGFTKTKKTIQTPAQGECGGFKTAGGKNIKLSLSDEQIKESRKLFADILYPGEGSLEKSRSNKYAFLSKNKSENFEKHKSSDTYMEEQNLTSTSRDETKLKEKSFNDELFFNSNGCNLEKPLEQPSLGFRTASGKGVHIPESSYTTARKKFSDDLSQYELKCLPDLENNEDIIDHDEIDILSTQETNELFSDFAIAENSHSATLVMNENEENFKGFTWDTVIQSRIYSQELSALITKISKEIHLASLPPQCRVSNGILEIKTKPIKTRVENMNFNPPFESGHSFTIVCESKINTSNKRTVGFALASGKKINISESALKSARNKFGEGFPKENLQMNSGLSYRSPVDESKSSLQNNNKLCTSLEHFRGFDDKSIEESQNRANAFIVFLEKFADPEATLVHRTKFPLHESHNDTLVPISTSGFTTARGNKLTVSESGVKRAQNVWKMTDTRYNASLEKLPGDENAEPSSGFQTAAGHSLVMSKDAINRARRIFQNIDNEISTNDLPKNHLGNTCSGFQTAAGSAFKLSEDSLQQAKQLFQNIDNELSLNDFSKRTTNFQNNIKTTPSFQTMAGTSLTLTEDTLSNSGKFENIDSEFCLNSSAKSTTSTNVSFEDDSQNSNLRNSTSINNKNHRKKRLGVSSCKQISIPKHKIEQAMRFFEDEKSTIMSPIRNNQATIYNSTPLKNVPFSNIDSDITPIKTVNFKQVEQELECTEDLMDDRILTRECTKGSVDSWSKILEKEKRVLETKLRLIEKRQKALDLQKRLTECYHQEHQKRRNGVLYDAKQRPERFSLKTIIQVDTCLKKYLNITPQNSELVHFNFAEQHLPYIPTLDGACVIPNINNHIGLSEIEIAFKVMPGINPKLIPSGWIRNHFKWVVWKLASYENFSSNVNNCLSVENVIQQLKYRYDREIDRAERSILRKFFEMDDAPQKRVVLCVSNIFNVQNGQFELELTDGWYSVRTVIDEPLCKQVTQRKIRLGTKLITCGAELLNCEGCHPLQAPDVIRLKISCNSTRRARWYVKLGYQKCPEPFPVKLCSVLPDGGLIGCIHIFIARVYPVKYMEKQNKLTVWRNRKAEELRAQEWENKRRQEMEKLRDTINRDYEMSLRTCKQNLSLNFTTDEIKNITCPETLFNLYQNNKDPEKFQGILSNSQRSSIVDYQQQILLKQQQDMSRKLEDSVSKLPIPKRDVTPVLQMLVIDVLDPDEKTCVFHIWRPSTEHVEVLKESSIFEAYNVLPKKNGDLCTMSRTRFQLSSKECSKFHKHKRTLFLISQVISKTSRPSFNEFDTVGVIVTMSTDSCSQSLWLADECGRLLFIKIFEGPKNCLLLDNLKVGQLVAVSNLVYCDSKLDFGEAIANHLSVISCYPKSKHLEDGISALNSRLPKDLKLLLAQSQQKISYYINKVDITKDYKSRSSTSLVTSNSLLTSDIFDDSSDVLFSMIDIDRVK